jgi:hypothetical protein
MYVKHDETIETRCLPSGQLRVEGDSNPKIVGYAAVFNTWADIGGWFRESIKPGAFAKTIRENDIRALIDHDPSKILGRNKAKPAHTLSLREDDKGLAVEISPPDTTYGRDLIVSMRRGDLTQMSFGFLVNKQSVDYEKDERILEDVTLFDVSVVTYPAYPTTSAELRAAFHKKEAPRPDRWEALDRTIAKLKAGDPLTEEELKAISACIPGLSVPPAKHTETAPEPPAKHSEADTRPRWLQLAVKVDSHISKNNDK